VSISFNGHDLLFLQKSPKTSLFKKKQLFSNFIFAVSISLFSPNISKYT